MQQNLDSTLIRNKIFDGVDPSLIPFSEITAELFSINEGRMLFKKGESAGFIYLIQSGEINHFIDDTSGTTQILVIEENDFVINQEFPNSENYSSSAIAMRDSFLIKIPQEEIVKLMTLVPKVLQNIHDKFSIVSGFSFEQPPLDYSSNTPGVEIDIDVFEGLNITQPQEILVPEVTLKFNSDDIFEKVSSDEHFSVICFSDVNIVVVNILDATMQYAPEIKALLIKLISTESKKIVVELNYCEMIDSTFLGALVLSLKKMNANKGELRLVCGNKPAWMIFEMTGMSKVFDTYTNLNMAMEGFYKK